MGNGWWDYLPNVVPAAASLVKARAVTWYELALPDLDETAAAHIKSRINEAQSGSKVNVLVLADPKVDDKQGKWKLVRGMLASESSKHARYEFPYQPPEEYDLRVVITPTAGENHIAVVFPTGAGAFAFNVMTSAVTFEDPNNRGRGRGAGGFPGRGPGGNDNLTHRLNRNLALGQRHTIVIKVRDAGIAAFLDGEQVFKLDFDAADIRPSRVWRLKEPKCVAVGSNETEAVVYSFDVLEVRGKGTVAKKPAESAAAAKE